MWPRQSHVLAPLEEADSGPKGRAILWNYYMEGSFQEIKRMVSEETILNYPYWKITFTVHIDASDKWLCDVINQNDKPIY